MTRVAYFDCVGGLAGDMLVAALLDAGGSIERLRDIPTALGIQPMEIATKRVERQGIGALLVTFGSPDDDDLHAHDRDWTSIRTLLERSALPAAIRDRALAVFARLADAEAHVHGVPPDQVHFHELGAVDTLMDVCGVVTLLDSLGVEEIACSPLPLSRGHVRTVHGTLPLPAPATLELLRGAPVYGVEGGQELVTPTGAALAAELAGSWGELSALVIERVGSGAGTRDLSDRANVVRVVLGEAAAEAGRGDVVMLETNLDDLSPELVPDAIEACFAARALDVWTVAAQMKKGRPGIVLAALARPADEAAVAHAILRETSTLGLRVSRLRRYELEREERVVELSGRAIRVKIGRLDGAVVNVAPEHDDCVAVAQATGRPVKSIWAAALAAAQEHA